MLAASNQRRGYVIILPAKASTTWLRDLRIHRIGSAAQLSQKTARDDQAASSIILTKSTKLGSSDFTQCKSSAAQAGFSPFWVAGLAPFRVVGFPPQRVVGFVVICTSTRRRSGISKRKNYSAEFGVLAGTPRSRKAADHFWRREIQ